MAEFVTVTPEEFEKIAIDIVEKAQKKGIVLRILGALAIYIHSRLCENYLKYFTKYDNKNVYSCDLFIL